MIEMDQSTPSNEAIPNENDWKNAEYGLDESWARKHFLGKSHEEARKLFLQDATYYYEDLMYMPSKCLYFYIEDYIDYLMSDESEGHSGGASCFYSILEIRLDDVLYGPGEMKGRVIELLHRLAEMQSWYDADPEIYDSFEEKSAKYLKLIT